VVEQVEELVLRHQDVNGTSLGEWYKDRGLLIDAAKDTLMSS